MVEEKECAINKVKIKQRYNSFKKCIILYVQKITWRLKYGCLAVYAKGKWVILLCFVIKITFYKIESYVGLCTVHIYHRIVSCYCVKFQF